MKKLSEVKNKTKIQQSRYHHYCCYDCGEIYENDLPQEEDDLYNFRCDCVGGPGDGHIFAHIGYLMDYPDDKDWTTEKQIEQSLQTLKAELKQFGFNN